MKPIEYLFISLARLWFILFKHNIRLHIVMKNGHVYKMNVIKWSIKTEATGEITEFKSTQCPVRGDHIFMKLSEIVAIYVK